IAAANLTVTPERLEQVDFSEPLRRNVSEVLVSGPSAPTLDSLEALSGRSLRLRRSSSYWSSTERLNASLRRTERKPVALIPANPLLEDHDLLELVHAGSLDFTVVDSHKAAFWSRVWDDVAVHPDLALREGGQIAWAFRKESPKLEQEVNLFVRTHRKGTLFGNIVDNRYLADTSWIRNPLDPSERERLETMAALFRKYGAMYGFDWRLLAAQGYQESRLDQRMRSRRGAVGVMQVKPETAADVGILDVSELESNIHAGAKYMRHLYDTYLPEEDLDPVQRHLLALASYNAGPSRIRRLRRLAAERGYDPNRWADNMDVVVARNVGREPVRYVGNILKYYAAYSMVQVELGEKSAR
ncbi:MAG: transglycosylase SLT domain-containing protein, partial [Proteobacteria bacterium]|nr:transglycosylase SLT domain-containing protein [Pseudomonadota bacterium]